MEKRFPKANFHVSAFTRFRRWLLRTTFRPVFRILCDVEIIGRENIPVTGPYIVANNHISLFEPPFILTFWPFPLEAVSGADVFDRPGQKIMVKAYGAIPVHRNEYDRAVIDNMLDQLDQGKSLLIAPEGGRSHSIGMRRAQPGVAYIMDKANVPVLPVGIIGSSDELLVQGLRGEKPLLQMSVGKAFDLPRVAGKGKARRQSRQDNADTVMKHIAALLPKKYHGVYANPDLPPTSV